MEIGSVAQLIDRVMKGASSDGKVTELKVGDLIKATVLSIDRSNMILDIGSGKRIMASDQSKINYNIGDKVQFEVADKKGETIILRSALNDDAILESKLKDTGITFKKDPDIKEGLKLLIENKIPLTEENVKGLEAKKSVKILASLIKDDIKVDEKALQENKEIILKGEVKEGVKTIVKAETPEGKEINSLKEFENMGKLLGSFNMKDLVFMIKNKVPINLSNITSHINLIEGKNTITSQVEKLEVAIDKTIDSILSNESDKDVKQSKEPTIVNDTKLKSALKEIKTEISKLKSDLNSIEDKDIKKDVNQFKELTSKLDDIKKEFNIPQNSDLSKALDDIKMSVDFMNSFEEGTAYMQIPINNKGEFKNMELFISQNKSNTKSIDEENCNIYISLDTFNLGRINTLIEIKANKVDLSFATDIEKSKRILKSKEAVIEQKIQDLGLTPGLIRYRIETSSVVNTDLVSNTGLNNLDIRV